MSSLLRSLPSASPETTASELKFERLLTVASANQKVHSIRFCKTPGCTNVVIRPFANTPTKCSDCEKREENYGGGIGI
jgi:hypothetical protein